MPDLSIGWPADGVELRLVDADGRDADEGVLWQRTPANMHGYLNLPEKTREVLTPDGWYVSGDVFRRDADGAYFFVGRTDDMFKAAGYRIGPGEIENCLVKHPAVANAAVVPKPDRDRGALVKAYVVIAPEYLAAHAAQTKKRTAFEADLTRQLQAHVRGLLAPYEYPKEIEFVEALPMTTTGKIQRRVLRLQEEERARVNLQSAADQL
jgi:acetyl-CoA synthetase